MRRFISNLSGRIEPFTELVKIKDDSEFRWGIEQQKAFDNIKEYLSTPPVPVPPQQGMSFHVYLFVGDTSIASILVQLHEGQEKVIFYLSRRMLDAETRYPAIEKLCLLLTEETIVICKSDVIKCHTQFSKNNGKPNAIIICAPRSQLHTYDEKNVYDKEYHKRVAFIT